MKYYQHKVTKTDLFILIGDTPTWLKTYVDGTRSKDKRVPVYCRLVATGEVALIHMVKWAYTYYLTEISEEAARVLDSALVNRIAAIARGEEEPRYHRTKHYGYLQEATTPQP